MQPLQLLSIIIPTRDEGGCIASTIEHLQVELRLKDVPHEIVAVGSKNTSAEATIAASSSKHEDPWSPKLLKA